MGFPLSLVRLYEQMPEPKYVINSQLKTLQVDGRMRLELSSF